MIDHGNNPAYETKIVSLKPQRDITTSSISVDANDISIIGFAAHFIEPEDWDPNSSTVKLLVEPAPDAELLP